MLRAYHGDAGLKARAIAAMAAQREAGALVQAGAYWQDGRGGAAGCLVRSEHHIECEARFGIPVAVARLLDAIFHALPSPEACALPERLLTAIEPGADLSAVGWRFLHRLLTDATLNPGIGHPLVHEAMAACAAVVAAPAAGAPIDLARAARAHGVALDAARDAVAALRACELPSAEWDRAFAVKEAAWSAAAAAESLEYAERADWSARSIGAAADCALRGAICADLLGNGRHRAAAGMADGLIELVRAAPADGREWTIVAERPSPSQEAP